jgi:ERCC4-related helicase
MHQESQRTEFQIGQIVLLKSNPSLQGAIIEVIPGKPESRYSVFLDGAIKTFYASQIAIKKESLLKTDLLALSQFHAYLSALQIRHPGLSTLYSLNTARVDFIPYQFRPVLKFIRSDRPRLLIADSVGVGKTIEAGLILRELQARYDVKSVLIICPRPLVTERKWQLEMRRFDERFNHLDGNALRYCINETNLEGIWPDQYAKAILPYSLLNESLLYGESFENSNQARRHGKGLLDLDPPPRFDLVIVDEAHHIRNPETLAHKTVRFFCENAEAVLFLTATPIQLGSDDLFVLLNVLRPDLIIDRQSFEHMAAPNPHINRAISRSRAQGQGWRDETSAALEQAAATPWGQAILQHDPEFQRILKSLQEKEFTPEQRIMLINDLEQMHTFSSMINRTRRRDIGEFTIRKSETVTVEFTLQQQKLHDDLLSTQAAIMSRLHGDQNVKFMMTTIRRQAASCLFGLAPLLREILTRHLDELAWEESDETYQPDHSTAINSIENQIRMVLKQAETLESHDPKLNSLRKILADKRAMPNNKVMVFSSFRHTLNYLYRHLNVNGMRVGLVHGSTSDDERVLLRNRFQLDVKDNEALDVLLFSEIGCEGLDYQFCDCIVNYDLPWNPMRIEQRIGRIDRIGQKSESVAIYNLITPGTVDADIYERCLLRIGVFNSALGGSEEILGQVTREIRDIAENLTLTEDERREKLQQIADNQIRLIQEQQELEEKQVELFGIRLPAEQMQNEIEQASSFWLSPSALLNLASQYLRTVCGDEQDYILGEKPLKTLRLSQEARNRLLQDFRKLPRQASAAFREWENWLKGTNPHLAITFEAACATGHPEATFITPLHPLVRQAADTYEFGQHVMTAFAVSDDSLLPGVHPFVIYQWQIHGIHEDLMLQPICQDETMRSLLTKLLENGHSISPEPEEMPARSVFDDLDSQHYKLWTEAREKHRDRTRQLASYRKESLMTSHRARLALLKEQLVHATDEKIRRMRLSQISSAEADYHRRIQELESAIEKAEITAQPVAFGIVKILEEQNNAQ